MTLLAWFVVLVVFGPLLVAVPAVLVLWVVGVFSGDGPQLARRAFPCPIKRRRVTAEFVIPAGEARPRWVVSCSAFKDPRRITCTRICRDMTHVRWTGPAGVFARWALLSGGVVGLDRGDGLVRKSVERRRFRKAAG